MSNVKMRVEAVVISHGKNALAISLKLFIVILNGLSLCLYYYAYLAIVEVRIINLNYCLLEVF